MDRTITLLPTNTPPTSVSVVVFTSLSVNPLPTSSTGMVRCLPRLLPNSPPASLRCLSLRFAPRACLCRDVPRQFSPPFQTWPAPRSLLTPGGFTRRWYLHLPCVPASPSLCHNPSSVIFWCLFSDRADYRARRRGDQEPQLPGSCSPQVLALPLYLAMPALLRLPPPPPL